VQVNQVVLLLTSFSNTYSRFDR